MCVQIKETYIIAINASTLEVYNFHIFTYLLFSVYTRALYIYSVLNFLLFLCYYSLLRREETRANVNNAQQVTRSIIFILNYAFSSNLNVNILRLFHFSLLLVRLHYPINIIQGVWEVILYIFELFDNYT